MSGLSEAMKALKELKGVNIQEMKQKAEQAEQRQIADHAILQYLVRLTFTDITQKEAFDIMMKELEK